MQPTRYQEGKLVRHAREPNSMGLVTSVVRNLPLVENRPATTLTPALYQIYWSAGTDKHLAPADCWYEEKEIEGVN
jgi:hypothetical protein